MQKKTRRIILMIFNMLTAVGEGVHAGHSHGVFGEWIESFFHLFHLTEKWTEFFTHLTVDALNVFFLIFAVMTVVYFLNSYINVDKLRKKLASLNSFWGFCLAVLIGMLSPFCSCSTIPVLLGFISMGVPVSVCLCFLTSASMINITALLSIYAVTGVKFATAYVGCALFIIIVSSVILHFMKLDNGVIAYHAHEHEHHEGPHGFKCRLKNALQSAFDVFKKCFVFVILGVTLSSALMVFFSIESITEVVSRNEFISVILVSLVGIPIHSDIFSIAPIIKLLEQISPAVSLAFTFSTMAISLPSVIIMTRALKAKTILCYCGVIVSAAVLLGYGLTIAF